MTSKCDFCGEFAVDDSENQSVCHACGIVVDEIKFSSEFNTRGPSAPFSKFQARLFNKKKRPLSLIHGLSVLDNLCHINNISSRQKAEITDLMKLITSVRHFKRKEDAGVTVACCLFLLLRSKKQAIAVNTLCRQVQCTKGKFSFFLKFLKSCLSSNCKFKQYSYFLGNGADEETQEDGETESYMSVIRAVCDKAKPEEKSQLMKLTEKLMKLASSCWILTGRSARGVAAASAFLCWKSMSPFRKKASFPKFCAEFEINEPIARMRLPELKDLLLKLGKKIPSYNEDYVNKENFLFHLNTILEHSETLRNDLFPDAHTREEVDSIEYSTFRIPCENHPRQEPTLPVQYDPNMNASDIEISDSEIESYVIPESKKIVMEICKKIKSELPSENDLSEPPSKKVKSESGIYSENNLSEPPLKKVKSEPEIPSENNLSEPPLKKVKSEPEMPSENNLSEPPLKKVKSEPEIPSENNLSEPPLKKVKSEPEISSENILSEPPLKKVKSELEISSENILSEPPLKKVESESEIPSENNLSETLSLKKAMSEPERPSENNSSESPSKKSEQSCGESDKCSKSQTCKKM